MRNVKRQSAGELIVNIITLCIIGAFFLKIDYSRMDIAVLLTSLLIGAVSLWFSMHSEKNLTIRRLFYIFVFVFMFAAPLQQYSKGIILWKNWGFNQHFTDTDRLKANLIIIITIAAFELGYQTKVKFIFSNKQRMKKLVEQERIPNQKVLLLLGGLSLVSFAFLAVKGELLTNYTESDGGSNLMIQIVHIAKFFPVASLVFAILQMQQIDKKYRRKNAFFLFVQIVEILIIYFPFSGSSARFLLFGAYLVIYASLASKSNNRAILFFVFIFGFFYVFSWFNIFKTAYYVEVSNVLTADLTGNDFDAYQMLMTAMKYVEHHGICYGGNFLSAILCFVPRAILPFRMENSGSLFMRYFGSGFENVSCPIFGEFYFAFGWIGLIVLGFLLGRLLRALDRYDFGASTYKRMVFCLITGLSVYLFRGSLLATWSFTFAFLLSTTLAYWVTQLYLGRSRKLKDVMENPEKNTGKFGV